MKDSIHCLAMEVGSDALEVGTAEKFAIGMFIEPGSTLCDEGSIGVATAVAAISNYRGWV